MRHYDYNLNSQFDLKVIMDDYSKRLIDHLNMDNIVSINSDGNYTYRVLQGDNTAKKLTWKTIRNSVRYKAKRERKLYKRTLKHQLYQVGNVAKIFVNITGNNTHVTISTLDDNSIKRTIMCSTGLLAGIKGTKRSTPLATDIVIKRAIYMLKKLNTHRCVLHLYRAGAGRGRSVVRKSLLSTRIKIRIIREVTAIPHNGTRKKSQRRV